MTKLSVGVRLHGAVVEHRVVDVRDSVRIGESPEAAVAFPGADILVTRHGSRLRFRSWWLSPGEEASIDLGPVQVNLELLPPRAWLAPPGWRSDVRLFVATAAVVLLSAWVDTVDAWLERNPAVTDDMHALSQVPPAQVLRAALRGVTADPGVSAGPDDAADGYGSAAGAEGTRLSEPVTFRPE